MKRHRVITLLGLSFASSTLLALSCGDDDAGVTPPPGTFDSGARPVDAAPADDGGIRRDSQILHILLTANTGEVEQGQLAQLKATRENVRSFGVLMVSDHSAANQRVQVLAQQLGVSLEPNNVSTILKGETDAKTAQLQQLVGDTFDRAYIDVQILAHNKLLLLIDNRLLPATIDPSVRAEVTTTRASVAAHLQQAQQIRSAILVSTTDAGVGADAGADAAAEAGADAGVDAGPGLDAGDGGILVP
jgi:putative membrane protein